MKCEKENEKYVIACNTNITYYDSKGAKSKRLLYFGKNKAVSGIKNAEVFDKDTAIGKAIGMGKHSRYKWFAFKVN